MVPPRRGRSPQFPCAKTDIVERLWSLVATVGIGVRIDKRSVQQMNHSLFSAHVSWQASMAGGIEVSRYDVSPTLKRGLRLPAGPVAWCPLLTTTVPLREEVGLSHLR